MRNYANADACINVLPSWQFYKEAKHSPLGLHLAYWAALHPQSFASSVNYY